MITDSAPSGLFNPLIGEDAWMISNQFREQDITLIVVGVGQGIVECDDFYCALAENTGMKKFIMYAILISDCLFLVLGGAYIPLVNAGRILSSVVELVINEEDTIRQALLHISEEDIEENSSFKYSAMKH